MQGQPPMAANAKPAQAFPTKKGRLMFFYSAQGTLRNQSSGRGLFRRNGGDDVPDRPVGKGGGLRAGNSGRRGPATKDDFEEPALSLDRASQRKRVHERGRVRPRKRDDRSSAHRIGTRARPLAALASRDRDHRSRRAVWFNRSISYSRHSRNGPDQDARAATCRRRSPRSIRPASLRPTARLLRPTPRDPP